MLAPPEEAGAEAMPDARPTPGARRERTLTQTIWLRLSPPHAALLRAMAARNAITVDDQARLLVEQGLLQDAQNGTSSEFESPEGSS
jgi:hypothetical protein